MTSPPVVTQIGAADPNANPITINELITLLNKLIHSEIVGDYLSYFVGPGPPGIADRNKVWLRTDSQGRPIEAKIWYTGPAGGAWRRIYNGMIGEIRMYNGITTNFDTTGRGLVGGTYDGWALCNGQNGTVDLSDKFVIAAHMNNVQHPGHDSKGWVTWISNVESEHTGGVRDITLNAGNTYRPARPIVTVDKWAADGNAKSNSGQLWGSGANPHDTAGDVVLLPADAGNTTPPSISTLPPFMAMAFIQFIGYQA
jgi:hypothetical protein